MEDPAAVTVDGVTYSLALLNDEARAQVNNLRFVDQEIAALHARLAVYGTARLAYENALRLALPRSLQ